MKQASLTHLRRNLSSMLNAVNNDHEPLIVNRRRGKPVVVMSLEDYEAMGRAVPAVAPAPARPAATPMHAAVPRRVSSPAAHQLLRSFSEVDEITFVPRVADKPEETHSK